MPADPRPVKLIFKDNQRMVFRLAKQEKATLLRVLSHYPALSSSFHLPPDEGRVKRENQVDQELLEHALAEEKKAHRQRLDQFLADPARWGAHQRSWKFCLEADEVDWFLQVLNDVRVGMWYRVGCPDGPESYSADMSLESLRNLWCMELAGAFQSMLIETLDRPG